MLHFRDVLVEFGMPQNGPTIMRSDNKSVIDLSLDAIAFKKTKHIMRAANFLRDLCTRCFFKMVHIAGTHNVADILTKAVTLAVFRHLMSLMAKPL